MISQLSQTENKLCMNCGSQTVQKFGVDKIICMQCGQVVSDIESINNDRMKKVNKNSEENNFERNNIYSKEQLQKEIVFKWLKDAKIADSTENNMARGLAEITKLGIELDLPKSVLEKASVIYLKIIKKCSLKGHSITNIATSTIYLTCKECNNIKSIEEISSSTGIAKKELVKSYKFTLKNLRRKPVIVSTYQYLPSIYSKLKLSDETKIILEKILQAGNKARLTIGKNPIGTIAAAIYISTVITGEHITQREISEKIRITQTTIRNRYKEIINNISIELPL